MMGSSRGMYKALSLRCHNTLFSLIKQPFLAIVSLTSSDLVSVTFISQDQHSTTTVFNVQP